MSPVYEPGAGGGGGGGSPTGSAGGDLGGSYPNPTVAELSNYGVVPVHPSLAINTSIDATVVDTALKPVFCPIILPAGIRRFSTAAIRFYLGTAGAGLAGFAIYSVAFSGAQTFSATKICDLGAATTIDCSTGGTASKGADWSGGPFTLDFTTTSYFLGSMFSTTTPTFGNNTRTQWLGTFRFASAVADATGASFPSTFTQTSAAAVIQGTTVPVASLLTTAGKNGYA